MGDNLPDPNSDPELFESLLTRRVSAFIVDSIILSIMVFILTLILFIAGLVTFGITWLTIPIILPISILIYYSATLGSDSRATIGMRMFDIILVPTKGLALDGWKILIHPIVYWISIWAFAPLLFIGLFTQRRQLLHDFITSTMMLRKSPLQASSIYDEY
jgi:uncharacterized RDD family membrane protein YckC